jgi:hypothetical protein
MTADDGKKDSRPLTAENRPQIRKSVFGSVLVLVGIKTADINDR